MHLIIRILVNAVALMIVAYVVPGVHVSSFVAAIVVALVLGVVNAIIKPILIILSLPIEILTLGLFTFVINAILFYCVGLLGIGLSVANFLAAFLGALVLTIVSWLLSSLVSSVER